MIQQSTNLVISTNSETSEYQPQSMRTSDIVDVQRHVTESVIQRIGQIASRMAGEAASNNDDQQEEIKVIRMPRIVNLGQPGESFAAVQEWEGVVTEIRSDLFLAELVDITAQAREANELAEIPIEDIQEQDQELLAVGAIFRWVIGYHRTANGTKTRGSRIHFRKPLQLTQKVRIPELAFEE